MPCNAEDAARLIDHCRRLVSSLEMDEVADRAVSAAVELLGAEAGRLLMCTGEEGEALALRRVLRDGNLERPAGHSVPRGRGLVGLAAEKDRGVLCEDSHRDPRLDPEIDGLSGFEVRSAAVAPMSFDDRRLGVLQVMSTRPGAFAPEHLEMLEHLSAIAAAATHNAHMHRMEIERGRARYELSVAAEIQKGLLPAELPDTGSFEFDAVCIPAAEVGGDLYDVFPFPDGRLCAVLGDVSGKGVPAALYMTWMVAELRLLSERASGLPEMMAELNRRLHARSRRGMFVTLMAGLFSPQSGEIEVASAGHHPPLLRRSDGTVEEVPYPSAPPLGILPEQQYPTACYQLARGEAALGFTDGVVEARNADGDEYGLERLKQVLAREAGPRTIRRVLRSLARFTGGQAQRDDTTMVLMWRKEA